MNATRRQKPKSKKKARSAGFVYAIVTKKIARKPQPELLLHDRFNPPQVHVTKTKALARIYPYRKGAHRFLSNHPELKKRFRYIRVAA